MSEPVAGVTGAYPDHRGPPRARPRAAFDVERVREDFPILRRQIHGRPLVYLDNAATTQKPQAVLDAMDRLLHDQQRERAPRRAPAERARHRGLRGRAARRSGRSSTRHRRARSSSRATPPRASTWWRTRSAAGASAAGDEVVISAMEHHSNIVPWQLLCEERGARLRVAPIDDRGELDARRARRAARTPRTRLLAVTHMSNALGTINPVRDDRPHGSRAAAFRCWSTGRRRRTTCRSTCGRSTATSTWRPGTSCTARPASACSTARRSLLEAMPPFLGGGDMIASVTFEKSTWNDVAVQVRSGHAGHRRRGRRSARRSTTSTASGSTRSRAHERDLLAYGTDGAAGRPGRAADRHGAAEGEHAVVRDGGRASARHRHDRRSAKGVAIRTGHHCAQPVMERFGVPATARASLAMYNTREDIDALVTSRSAARSREVLRA